MVKKTGVPGSFESSLQRLEEIVARLEGGELPLEDSLKSFEEGMKLVKVCEQRLNEFQKKIEILMKDQDSKKREVRFGTEEE